MMGYPGMRQNSADIILIPRGLAGGGGGGGGGGVHWYMQLFCV